MKEKEQKETKKTLSSKIDFALIFTARKTAPNLDPESNEPRIDRRGYGEITGECIRRKIRNRLQDMGESIYVQMEDRCDDGMKSLNERMSETEEIKAFSKAKDIVRLKDAACAKWIDVRAFGTVSAVTDTSFGITGPVTICIAETVDPIEIVTHEITKSVNGTEPKKGDMSSDRMGHKSHLEFGLFVCRGAMECQQAERTGFTDEDAEKIKQALLSLFENDASAARPAGSMTVRKLIWWNHGSKNSVMQSGRVQDSLHISRKSGIEVANSYDDYDITVDDLDKITRTEYNL